MKLPLNKAAHSRSWQHRCWRGAAFLRSTKQCVIDVLNRAVVKSLRMDATSRTRTDWIDTKRSFHINWCPQTNGGTVENDVHNRQNSVKDLKVVAFHKVCEGVCSGKTFGSQSLRLCTRLPEKEVIGSENKWAPFRHCGWTHTHSHTPEGIQFIYFPK